MHSFIDQEPVDLSGKTAITAAIDGDSIAYIVGWGHRELDDIDAVLKEVDNFVSQMLAQVQARQYAGFLSPKVTFRNILSDEYKAKRKPPHPGIAKWKPYINRHLMDEWGFVEWIAKQQVYEADDAVSMLQNNMENTIVCSIDKDAKQIPGNHFNYKSGERYYIEADQAQQYWAYQMLVGDSGDNVKGCPRVGEKTAPGLLFGYTGEDLVQRVFDIYNTCPLFKSQDEAWAAYKLAAELITTAYNPEDGDMEFLQSNIHTFDLDAAGTTSYLSASERTDAAEDIFGSW